jgi:anti-sigma factor RsiW
MRASLTCREFVAFLDDYLSGRLSPRQKRRFEEHLAACPSCVAYKNTFETAVRLGRVAVLVPDPEALPDEAPVELVHAILAAREDA